MIWYDQQYIMRNMIGSLSKRNLEFVGEYDLWVKSKAIVKHKRATSEKFILELEDEEKMYSGMMVVNAQDYQNAKKGKLFVRGGILVNKKYNAFYLFTKEREAKKAIDKIVGLAWLKFIFFMTVCVAVGLTLMSAIIRLI